MNGEGGLSEAEQQFWSLKRGVYAGFEFQQPGLYIPGAANVPLGDIYSIIGAGISAAQGGAVPEIFPTVSYSETGVPSGEIAGDQAVLPSVIDPEVGTQVTVFEEEVASRGPVSPKPTNWDEVYAEYVILNPEVPVPVYQEPVPSQGSSPPAESPGPVQQGEEDQVSVWTDVAGGIARAIFPLPTAAIDLYQGYNQPQGIVAGPVGLPPPVIQPTVTVGGGMASAATCPPTGPKYAKVCLATGAVMPLRQRRRRRLLTSSDLSDLAALKALFGNSAGVQAALVKAVRR